MGRVVEKGTSHWHRQAVWNAPVTVSHRVSCECLIGEETHEAEPKATRSMDFYILFWALSLSALILIVGVGCPAGRVETRWWCSLWLGLVPAIGIVDSIS